VNLSSRYIPTSPTPDADDLARTRSNTRNDVVEIAAELELLWPGAGNTISGV